ncbi:hypothetical protein L6164_026580 [Bauhinia variegata]|uniref:Uncharacterized protein n=1 Tax=Bauhinia variegata TaxID=167791 RepID=A0ACB9LRI7_BAUVA|nr:hypothetical protein L6164_026580 [Bauhinia variegata]
MRLWERAAGVLKDKNSIWAAKLSRQTRYRNSDLETAIIKATSHDEHHLDCKNLQRVFQWVRTNPSYLKPLICALSKRMEKTKNWVVAVKGLMLFHGVFCCDIPSMQMIGRLPFDLSNFKDSHSRSDKKWGFTAFIRAYFAYLDQRSAFVCSEVKKRSQNIKQGKKVEETLMEELERLQKIQILVDMLLQIKPRNRIAGSRLVLEAMDCVMVEVFDLYSKFCKAIARVLMKIYHMGGMVEATICLKILQKAANQGDELSLYFKFCRDIGVINASQCPKIERIRLEEIQDLERMINDGTPQKKLGFHGDDDDEKKVLVVRDNYKYANAKQNEEKSQGKYLKTVITDKWEVFEEDYFLGDYSKGIKASNGLTNATSTTNPFDELYSLIPYLPAHPSYNQVLPDLISL